VEPSGPVQDCNGIALPLIYTESRAADLCSRVILTRCQYEPLCVCVCVWQSTWSSQSLTFNYLPTAVYSLRVIHTPYIPGVIQSPVSKILDTKPCLFQDTAIRSNKGKNSQGLRII